MYRKTGIFLLIFDFRGNEPSLYTARPKDKYITVYCGKIALGRNGHFIGRLQAVPTVQKGRCIKIVLREKPEAQNHFVYRQWGRMAEGGRPKNSLKTT
jgi:hypothetical protein